MRNFRNAKRVVDYGRALLETAGEKVLVDRDALATFVRLAKDHPRYRDAVRISRQLEKTR